MCSSKYYITPSAAEKPAHMTCLRDAVLVRMSISKNESSLSCMPRTGSPSTRASRTLTLSAPAGPRLRQTTVTSTGAFTKPCSPPQLGYPSTTATESSVLEAMVNVKYPPCHLITSQPTSLLSSFAQFDVLLVHQAVRRCEIGVKVHTYVLPETLGRCNLQAGKNSC